MERYLEGDLRSTRLKGIPIRKPRENYPLVLPAGCYVYGWYSRGWLFYVGRGQDERAWEHHGDHKCQAIRDNVGDGFECKIIKDGLTEREAMIAETVTILTSQPIGNVAGKRTKLLTGKEGPERYTR